MQLDTIIVPLMLENAFESHLGRPSLSKNDLMQRCGATVSTFSLVQIGDTAPKLVSLGKGKYLRVETVGGIPNYYLILSLFLFLVIRC
jgi:hypothetical protein